MLQKVNTVLIGKFVDAAPVAVGEIALFDAQGNVIEDADGLDNKSKIRFGRVESLVDVTMPNGTVTQKPNIRYSQYIDRERILTPTIAVLPYAAPVEEKIAVKGIGTMTVAEGTRYVVKIIYKDLSEYKFQVTKSYDYVAKAGDTGAIVMAALNKAINKDINRRVQSVINANDLELTAKVKTDNEGLNAINSYSQVDMFVTFFAVKASAHLYNKDFVPAGITIQTLQEGKPGKGNAKIVRDREKEAWGYRGVTNRTEFPVDLPNMTTDLSAQYNTLVIEWELPFRTPDNQYIKTTPLSVEVYSTSAIPAAIVEAIKL